MRYTRFFVLTAALFTIATVPNVFAQEDDNAPPPAPYPCTDDPKHHAFDFWIGEWRVTQNGEFAGTNRIKPLLGHCTIFEEWTSATGRLGKSFNYYDPAHDHWRQIWISDSGTFIEFTGEARDGGIFYTAETVDAQSKAVIAHRFEFTQNGDGTVRQFWEISRDDGETWQTIWDGHYAPLTNDKEKGTSGE